MYGTIGRYTSTSNQNSLVWIVGIRVLHNSDVRYKVWIFKKTSGTKFEFKKYSRENRQPIIIIYAEKQIPSDHFLNIGKGLSCEVRTFLFFKNRAYKIRSSFSKMCTERNPVHYCTIKMRNSQNVVIMQLKTEKHQCRASPGSRLTTMGQNRGDSGPVSLNCAPNYHV